MLTELRLNMLNKEAVSAENKPYEIIEHLNIKEGMVLGDIGSGGGFFVQEFSKKVGDKGLTYAIDVNQKSLDYIEKNLKKETVRNVKTFKANPNNIDLPEKSFDLFFLRNVFHHLPPQVKYFKNLKKLLKENGKIAIIDYNRRKLSFTGLFGHYTPDNVLLEIMDEAGLYPIEKYDFLPDQLFMVFTKK
jgi:ubiquinone/menaquinone biosynthesis C-methylase UbiE